MQMTSKENHIIIKVRELETELKECGLWLKFPPSWTDHFDEVRDYYTIDFVQWLQFIFIPNHLHQNGKEMRLSRISIVPQAIKYFQNDVKKGKLLQILIEIDSIV